MSNHNTLFNNSMHFVCSSRVRFHDLRLLTTFVWAIVGLLISESINLSQWLLFRSGPAKASSKQRQLSRWLHNPKINPMAVYLPFVQQALLEWTGETMYLALDTSQLWNRYAIVRLAMVYRGRALPLGWTVLNSGSATVALERYQSILVQVASVIPADSQVVLLADRGFLDVKLMQLSRDLGWHFRIRIKSSIWIYRATKRRRKVKTLMPAPGCARFFTRVWLTEQRLGPVHLALAYVQTDNGYEKWAIVSDEPAGLETLDEYGLRFDIEENFLDDKSAGFDLESSEIRDANALSRLCLILAVATIYLVSTGTAVVEMGRRWVVDTHWQRGLSYFQIGWRWVKRALHCGEKLLAFMWLSAVPDPEPAMASWKQFLKPDLRLSRIEWL
jgi:hypothetical protein